jgi:peroxiredoxin
MKKIMIITLLVTLMTNVFGQNHSKEALKAKVLKGLKKLSVEKKDSSQKEERRELKISFKEASFYDEDMTVLDPMKMSTLMTSGEYLPDVYKDSLGKVKVCIFRKATEEEKIKMLEFKNKETTSQNGMTIDFDVADIYGNEYSLDSLKGKVIVLNFWFIECVPCIQEMPELNKLVEKYKNKGVVFLGFSTNKRSKIMEFLKDHEFKYQIIAESYDVIQSFNVQSFPTSMIIDQNSKITYSKKGLASLDIKNLENAIESLLTK